MGSLYSFRLLARFVFCAIFLAGSTAVAAAPTTSLSAHGFLITIEPILGYEYTNRDTPTPHKAGMLIYGARFTVGRPHLAIEGEYTRGNDTEVFTSPSPLTTNTNRENVRLGGRASYDVTTALSTFLRFGGQASKSKVESIDASATSTSSETGWDIRPYAGAGFQLTPLSAFSLGIEANYVFYSLSDWTKNSVQFATSLRVHFNTR